MNDEIVADLKQFIAATVKQEGASIKDDIREELSDFKNDIRGKIKTLSDKIDDIVAKLDTVIEATGDQFDDHEQRIKKLEIKPA